MTRPLTMPTAEDYAAAFEAERVREYPEVDLFVAGYELERGPLEAAAAVLACPVKASPPNWQHGRVLYAAARRYLADVADEPILWFDCGTAKGFSALIGVWALRDAERAGRVESVDVIDPYAKVFRNSVLDVTGEHRLADYLRAWPEAETIRFHRATGVDWLNACTSRVHVAFLDGKHQTDVVAAEGRLLASLQKPGDLVVFDDVQIPGVWHAVQSLAGRYAIERLDLSAATRGYAIGVRR